MEKEQEHLDYLEGNKQPRNIHDEMQQEKKNHICTYEMTIDRH